MKAYILAVDQSTQGTKAILTDETGKIVGRCDKKHRQLVNDLGWVSHDMEEVYANVKHVIKEVIETSNIHKKDIKAIGLTNQRETTVMWHKNGKPVEMLPELEDSNGDYGSTTLEGYFENPVSIMAVMGDSHGALYAQGCHAPGMVKATYGTGSSIMMNIGAEYKKSEFGLATSLAWGIDGQVNYVLEGNINYTGAVISWLQNDLKLIDSPAEVEPAVLSANVRDTTIFVPAFSGLSAPHWKNDAKAMIYGMSRTTGRCELIKAAVESIAYQITDVLKAMESDSGVKINQIRVDGGPTRNKYLMQFQSDISDTQVQVQDMEEFSALGVAYMAGIKSGIYDIGKIFNNRNVVMHQPIMMENERHNRYNQWKEVLNLYS